MAVGLAIRIERRRSPRLCPSRTPWQELALLRPGQEVAILNVSRGGALLQSLARMSPGARAELHLFGVARRVVRGRIDRCHVSALQPLRYTAAMVFDEGVEVGSGKGEG